MSTGAGTFGGNRDIRNGLSTEEDYGNMMTAPDLRNGNGYSNEPSRKKVSNSAMFSPSGVNVSTATAPIQQDIFSTRGIANDVSPIALNSPTATASNN